MKHEVEQNVDVKERIIEVTIALIQAAKGNVSQVTMRDIAERANIGVGLINYHFTSKDNLIAVCVEQIIGQVMRTFKGNHGKSDDPKANLIAFTVSVFSFLKDNPEIAKISMLSDLNAPHAESNSATSYRAILQALPVSIPNKKRTHLAFMLLSTIQSAFLNRTIAKDLFGFDLLTKRGTQAFFEETINLLLT